MKSFLQNINEFVEVLRLSGIRTSVSETLDAVSVLNLMDLTDRKSVRLALASCFAKSEEDRKIFDEAFEQFFISPDIKQELLSNKTGEIAQRKMEIEEEASTLKFKDEPLNLSDEQKMVYSDLSTEEKDSILSYLDKSSIGKNVRNDLRPLVEKMVAGRLDKYRQELYGSTPPPTGMLQSIPSEAGFIAGKVVDSIRAGNDLLYKNIADISEEDIPAMIRLIRTLSEKMYRHLSRKKIISGRKSGLDLKRTLRCNMSTGHVLFKLKYKSHAKKSSPCVILCDVSASMARFSGFVLQFVLGMNQNAAHMDTYIFSQSAEPLNPKNIKKPADFVETVRQSSVWGKGTNIGQAIEEILSRQNSKLHSSTIILLVSDAKTLDTVKLLDNLEKLGKKVKTILWFNPIPASHWDKIPCISEIQSLCRMLDTSNLMMLTLACTSIQVL